MPSLAIDDPFAAIRTATDTHRSRHGCGAYPYDKGTMLGVLAATVNARRIVEVGTALGYTSLWFAHGAPQAEIDTIELDPDHVQIARQHFIDYAVSDRVRVHQGEASTVLEGLEANVYDLAFFDGFEPTSQLLDRLCLRLRTGGLLICANLTLGGQAASRILTDSTAWLTHSLGETALAVKR